MGSSGNRTRRVSGTPVHTGANASGTSAQLLAANTSRNYLYIQNQDPTNAVWVGFGIPAVADKTCLKIAAGGKETFENTYCPTSAVNIICSAGTPAVQAITDS